MRIVLAAAVFVLVMAFDLRPVQAYGDAPWCTAVTMGRSRIAIRISSAAIAVFANQTPIGMAGT
jgi:hypothetical protein